MSYRFSIPPPASLCADQITHELAREDVHALLDGDEDHSQPLRNGLWLYKPHASTRGVRVQRNEDGGIDIDIKAFSTHEDARLGRTAKPAQGR